MSIRLILVTAICAAGIGLPSMAQTQTTPIAPPANQKQAKLPDIKENEITAIVLKYVNALEAQKTLQKFLD